MEILQWITGLSAPVATYFLYRFVKQFDEFKKETKKDIIHLTSITHGVSEKVGIQVVEIQKSVNDVRVVQANYRAEVETAIARNKFALDKSEETLERMILGSDKLVTQMEVARDKLFIYDSFSKKSLLLNDAFNKRLVLYGNQIASFKVQLSDALIMIKTKTDKKD